MKRILSSWPYALGMIGLFSLNWAFFLFSWSCDDPYAGCWGLDTLYWKELSLTVQFLVSPALVFLGAALLGFRRGYDWVTVLVCLVLSAAIPDPIIELGGQITLYWGYRDWFFYAIYIVVIHLGIAAGLVVRAVVRRRARGRAVAA